MGTDVGADTGLFWIKLLFGSDDEEGHESASDIWLSQELKDASSLTNFWKLKEHSIHLLFTPCGLSKNECGAGISSTEVTDAIWTSRSSEEVADEDEM